MGAGKSTVGAEVARLTSRPFVDLDRVVEERHGPIPELFGRGEAEFRRIEQEVVAETLARPEPAVLALGGGAVESEETRARLRRHAFAVHLQVDVETAWSRARGSDRPLARHEGAFHELYDARQALYRETAGAAASDADGVLLAALGIEVEPGALAQLDARVPPGSAALVADGRVLELHRPPLDAPAHVLPSGEEAKRLVVVERLYDELSVDRGGTIVGFGGGTTTDVAGFVAATYLRGIRWIAVPSSLVGQVDAAIGGKTAVDLAKGKNLVGAFHYPERVVIDPELLRTLPAEERRAGMAEVVKTGLLAGRPLWELPEEEMVCACAAFKAAICLGDPFDQGGRAILNLGHTFAHALEAASDYGLRHGDAVALGLLAALRLSELPTDAVEQLLRPEPVPVDRERAWAALRRDKKAADGRTRLVLLEAPGRPVFPAERPDADVRRELNALIARQ